jgi:uncharacterized delta-60 repeat protein
LFLVAVALASPSPAGQRAGDLDVTFGVGGRLVRPGFQVIEDVVVQPDGKILVVGNHYDESVTFNFLIARYNADGTADDTFGTGGVVETDFGGLRNEAKAVALQPDGRIVVAGMHGYEVWCCEYYYDLILVRYESDGSLDASFGDGGKVITDFGWEVDLETTSPSRPTGRSSWPGPGGAPGSGMPTSPWRATTPTAARTPASAWTVGRPPISRTPTTTTRRCP